MGQPRVDRQRWDPWKESARRPHLTVERRDLAGRKGVWRRDDRGDHIVVAIGLDPSEERAVLTHELIHAERGIGFGWASPVTMAKEEHLVRCETARRLVDPPELRRWLRSRAEEPTSIAEVAVHFGVPLDVAELAVELLSRSVDRGIDG